MEDLIAIVAQGARQGRGVALASLVESSGSIPMSERAKMVVCADGRTYGTIGGGCLEAEVLAVARDVLESRRPHSTRYTMTEQQAGEHGLNCGGTVRIYTECIDAEAAELFAEIARAKLERRPCVLATALEGRGRALFHPDGTRQGQLEVADPDVAASWAAQALERERPDLQQLSGAEVFVEPFAPPPQLYVFGGGHVGGQICRLAHNVGFRVVVVDDRPYFAGRDRHPDADECIADEIPAVFDRIPIDDQTYIIAATRGHEHDEIVVERAIATRARYVGMLGSERKKRVLWERIEGRGGSRARLDGVYAPVGLNIGADTPEEIAVSVVGELIDVRRSARRKRWKTKRPSVTAGD